VIYLSLKGWFYSIYYLSYTCEIYNIHPRVMLVRLKLLLTFALKLGRIYVLKERR